MPSSGCGYVVELNRTLTPRRGACTLLLPLLLAAWAPLHAQQGTGAPQLLNVAPVAFQPANNFAHYIITEGGLGQLCSSRGAGYFVAPLSLEHGAVIERITACVRNANEDGFAMLSLLRRAPEHLELLAVTPVSSGPSKRTSSPHDRPTPEVQAGRLEMLSSDSITAPVVDNQHYSYLLQAVLTAPKVCLCGAQVTYRKP